MKIFNFFGLVVFSGVFLSLSSFLWSASYNEDDAVGHSVFVDDSREKVMPIGALPE